MLGIHPLEFAMLAASLVAGITAHELGHGWMASRLGDDTAESHGRMRWNPLAHISLLGTLAIPLVLILLKAPFLFGWAKPMPVNPSNFAQPRRDMALVALAGPAVNLAIALGAGLLLAAIGEDGFVARLLGVVLWVNILLAVFNLLPIPPLDGGQVLLGLCPDRLAQPVRAVASYSLQGLLIVVLVGPIVGRWAGVELDPFREGLIPAAQAVADAIGYMTGGRASLTWL